MTNVHDFAYSVGLVRALETMLLNSNELERMMLAKDADEAFKILNEFDYADNKAGVESTGDFQKVLNEGLIDIKHTLDKISPNDTILNILWHAYDFHNIKVMLKAKLSGKTFEDIEGILSQMGKISTADLRQFIFEEENLSFKLEDEQTEKYIQEKTKRAEKLFKAKRNNPQVIDLYLDQKLIKTILRIAEENESPFLVAYIKTLIDLTNIQIFFRMKSQEKEEDLFEVALLWNGHTRAAKFREAYKKKLSDFPETMKNSNYAKIVETGYQHYQEEKSFIYLEKEIANHLTNKIKGAKLVAFGPEPLIAYFLSKKNNALIIRMILVNKLNKIPAEEIQKRLRTLYT
jgi:V/A-type H+/Na+-transporting ATPase subunit C